MILTPAYETIPSVRRDTIEMVNRHVQWCLITHFTFSLTKFVVTLFIHLKRYDAEKNSLIKCKLYIGLPISTQSFSCSSKSSLSTGIYGIISMISWKLFKTRQCVCACYVSRSLTFKISAIRLLSCLRVISIRFWTYGGSLCAKSDSRLSIDWVLRTYPGDCEGD